MFGIMLAFWIFFNFPPIFYTLLSNPFFAFPTYLIVLIFTFILITCVKTSFSFFPFTPSTFCGILFRCIANHIMYFVWAFNVLFSITVKFTLWCGIWSWLTSIIWSWSSIFSTSTSTITMSIIFFLFYLLILKHGFKIN